MKLKASIRRTGRTIEYPAFGILVAMTLILLAPFVTTYLCYAAFLICLYRIIRYDAKVFATDYCILIPTTQFFRTTGGMTFLIWLCLIAAVWFLFHGTIRASASLVLLFTLLIYLITRMQMVIDGFVLCFGQMFTLYVLMPKQDAESAERTVKAFCWSVLGTSLYALVFRNAPQILAIRGQESIAVLGTSITRFSGLIKDPNYYMTMLVTGIGALCKLKETGRVQLFWFWGQVVAMTAFGILTYSKTFFLMVFFLMGLYIKWQFWNKKYFKGVVFAILCVLAGIYFLMSKNSPFAVVLKRLAFGSSLSNITTGRSDVYIRYWNAIVENVVTFLFGFGLKAPMLGKGTHMLYLELMYYVGVLGLIIVLGFFFSLIQDILIKNPQAKKQSLIAKYAVLAIVAIQYISLQGMFQVLTYGVFFVAFLTIIITPKEVGSEERPQDDLPQPEATMKTE